MDNIGALLFTLIMLWFSLAIVGTFISVLVVRTNKNLKNWTELKASEKIEISIIGLGGIALTITCILLLLGVIPF